MEKINCDLWKWKFSTDINHKLPTRCIRIGLPNLPAFNETKITV